MNVTVIFRQLFDPQSSTYTYLLGDSGTGEAVLIDPVLEQFRRDAAVIDELGLKLAATLETHVHADHVTSARLLRARFGSTIVLSKASGAEGADRYLEHGDVVTFGNRSVAMRSTPGHTSGCVSFVMDDESAVFTGDALLIRGCGRTDFQQGSASTLYNSVREQLFSLPDACLVYPGHDYKGLTVSSVGEERENNPRLGARVQVEDFIGYMDNLGLAHPKQIDRAVPANMLCGEIQGADEIAAIPEWAPLNLTVAGVWEVDPAWVAENSSNVQLVDVREADEFDGPLGRIEGAVPIPIGNLLTSSEQLDSTKPVVMVCRSGARSAQATLMLGKQGDWQVANLAGGMFRWRAERLPVLGGEP